jgi:hypothetical protein
MSAGATSSEQAPTFTLTADNLFDIQMMFVIASVGEVSRGSMPMSPGEQLTRRISLVRRMFAELSPERRAEIRAKRREFDLWEETHRR